MVNAQSTTVVDFLPTGPTPTSKSLDMTEPLAGSTHSSDSASSESRNSDSANGSPADTLVDSQVLGSSTDASGADQVKQFLGNGGVAEDQGRKQMFENGHGHGVGNVNGNAEFARIAMVVVQLHRFCAEGDVMGVRSILSQNLELVETIDITTGWTPMLSAIYASQPDVVRELLLAGAYPPPPSVTSDPIILSILYPQPVPHPAALLISPPFSSQPLPPMAGYSVPLPTTPDFGMFAHHQQGGAQQHFRANGHGHGHVEQRAKGVLPPADVAKAIPCRTFPNCRFGDACLFRHPVQQFYGQPGFAPSIQGFQQAPYSPTSQSFLAPQGGQRPRAFAMDGQAAVFQPLQNGPNVSEPSQATPATSGEPDVTSGAVDLSTTATVTVSDSDSAKQSAVTTASQPNTPINAPEAEPATSGAAAVESASPSNPQGNATIAQRPIITAPFNGNGNGEFPHGRKPFHAKKMSFNGGKGPNWGPNSDHASHMGSWTNGLPPPCVFFQANKCRNGQMCKFPHLTADGVDCRHPDVISGTIPPAPTNPNGPQNPRPRGRASFGGAFFQHGVGPPHPNFAGMHKSQMAQGRNDSAGGAPKLAPVADTESRKQVKSDVTPEVTGSSAAIPGQPDRNVTAESRSSSAAILSSKSVPNTRAGSPTRSPAATARVPRVGRQLHPAANGAATRSASAAPATKDIPQKVPSAADFPNLAGIAANGGASAGGWAGKMTLAQVLSAPAPVKAAAETSTGQDAPATESAAHGEGEKAIPGKEDQAKSAASLDQVPAPTAKPRRKIPSFKNAMDNVTRRTTISAPGKVLIAGGYLVLDPKYTGIVLASSARFYTSIASIELKESAQVAANVGTVIVASPQFLSAEWTYKVDTAGDIGVEQSSSASGSRNKFVELALRESFRLASAFLGSDGIAKVFAGEPRGNFLKITIAGDNDFYSQRQALSNLSLPLVTASLVKIAEFNSLGTTLGEVHKTGMGSSAALITSLVAAVLVHLGVVDETALSSAGQAEAETNALDLPLKGTRARDLVHNSSQYVHCLAQGKVGSGFDVSSAVYGSQIYRKFESSAIDHMMVEGLRLFLADVDAGSDTPSLVGKVLRWRQEKGDEAYAACERISKLNGRFADILAKLCGFAESSPDAYSAALARAADPEAAEAKESSVDSEQKASAALSDLAAVMIEIRREMKRMGESAGVPIEPDEQTKLLDACSALPGVIGGGVPGAGGYDALYLLLITQSPLPHNGYIDPGLILSRVEELFVSWKELSLCPLSCAADDEGGLRSHPNPNAVRGLAMVVGAPPYFSVSM